MQASKLKIGEIVAVHDSDKKLVPFQVASVTTTRTGTTPHDHRSMVSGYMLNDDRSRKHPEPITLAPDKLLGPFDQHVELVERKRAADAEANRKQAARKELQMQLVHLLYALIGEPVPQDPEEYKAIIRADRIGSGVDLHEDAFPALIKQLEPLVRPVCIPPDELPELAEVPQK